MLPLEALALGLLIGAVVGIPLGYGLAARSEQRDIARRIRTYTTPRRR